MKVLITGVSGFIGGNISNILAMEDDIDLYGVYNTHLPRFLYESINKLQINLANESSVKKVFEKYHFDTVIHFAGEMKGKYIEQYLNNTVISTSNVIKFSEDTGVSTFILGSSVMVYGNTDVAVNESSDRVNLDDYGLAKYFQERMLEDSSIQSRIALRLPRTLGRFVNLSLPYLPRMGGLLLKNEDVLYFNPGQLYNNMLHVDSLGDFIKTILENKGGAFNGYQAINLASSVPMTVYEVTSYLKDKLKSKSRLIERKDGIPRSTASCIDVKNAVLKGFNPHTSVDTLDKFACDLQNVIIKEEGFQWV